MHEGVLSLMQMAKTCSALASLNEAGGFSICVMTNPTTGGVTASFASVCDLTLAEPGALIGFAGPRVIATTIKQELPPGFQRTEFLLEKGQVDLIVERDSLRPTLANLIDYGTCAWNDYPPAKYEEPDEEQADDEVIVDVTRPEAPDAETEAGPEPTPDPEPKSEAEPEAEPEAPLPRKVPRKRAPKRSAAGSPESGRSRARASAPELPGAEDSNPGERNGTSAPSGD
jgi:hypothetical protein